jgi:hypothetical protein
MIEMKEQEKAKRQFNGMDFNNQRNLLLLVYDNLIGGDGCVSCYYFKGNVQVDTKCIICAYVIDNINVKSKRQGAEEVRRKKAEKILQFLRQQPPAKKIDLMELIAA